MSNVEHLKVGDVVAWHHHQSNTWRSLPIIRLTKMQFVTGDGNRWQRATGRMIGASGFHTPCCQLLTKAIRVKIEVEWARRYIGRLDGRNLTDKQMVEVAKSVRDVLGTFGVRL